MFNLKKFNTLYNNLLYEYALIDQQQNTIYIVKKGDTLSKIAKQFNTTVNILCQINNISQQNKNKLSIGQKLIISSSINNIQNNNQNNISVNNQQNNNQLNIDVKKQFNSLPEEAKKQVLFIARVLYSQTATKVSDQQVLLVATVIYNRIGFKAAFPTNYRSAYDVVNNKTQFSCIGDKKNSNWRQFKPWLNERTVNAVKIAIQLYKGTFKPLDADLGKWKKHYMYIDKSLTDTPQKFYSKKYWNLVNVQKTSHFKFYGLRPKNLKA